jgi:hypothetical protein
MESKNKRVPETLKRFNEASIDAKWRLVKTPVPALALSRARACGARRIDIVLYENALRAFSYNTISIRGTALPQACDGERGAGVSVGRRCRRRAMGREALEYPNSLK